MNNVTYAVSVDVNNPIIPYNVYVANVLDSNVRYLEITLYQNGNVIALSNEATATASLVTDNVLVDDSVECTISDNIITVPLEDLQRHGNLDVQVTVTEDTKVLAIPFPIQVRVTPNIAENAQIDENSLGSYAEVVQEIVNARGGYTTLQAALAAKANAAPGSIDETNLSFTPVKYVGSNDLDECINSGVLYHVHDGSAYQLVICSLGTYAKTQYMFTQRGTVKSRTMIGENAWSSWSPIGKNENLADGSITVEKVADDLAAVINGKEPASNKKTTLSGNESSNDFYPTTKAVADALSTKAPASTAYTFDSTTTNVTYNAANPKTIYLNATVDGEDGIIITAKDNSFQYFFGGSKSVKIRNKNGASTYTNWELASEKATNKTSSITSSNSASTEFYPSIKAVADYLSANYEATVNRLTSAEGIDINSTDTEYPTGKAVYDFGVHILDDIDGDITNINSSITQTNTALSDLKAYVGFTDGDILGLQCDFENRVFTRLGAAAGLLPGSDFNAFPMYGQRRRVVVNSDGEIQPDMDPEEITETDFDYDVMVYQPKFYYKVVPLKLEKQSGGLGYHIRKANYYITSTPHAGFRVHPLFIDKNGNEVDYVLFSAYEASYMYWHATSQSTGYYDIFHDGVDTDTTIETSAVLKSLPGVKPISGQYKAMNKVNLENCALRKSSNWHLDTIQSVSANQLLMAIELGSFNTQTAIGMGIVYNATSGSDNCSSLTGSTSALGNVTGMAGETIYDVTGTETPFNTNGKVAVSYRGMENPWGNIWKQVNGINFWSDGNMGGGQAYICSDFNFDESKHIGNYKSTGFSIVNVNGWVSAFGYGNEEYDWLFIPSEGTGNSSLPVGDSCACTQNLNGNRIAVYGGRWSSSEGGGGFYWACSFVPNYKNSEIGGRLLFVPTATV